MKTKRLIIAGIAIVPMALTSCNLFKKKKTDDVEFDFSVSLKSGKTYLERGQADEIVISSNLKEDEDTVTREYEFESSNEERLTVNSSGYVVAQDQLGSVKIHVTEKNSEIKKTVELSIDEPSDPASGGFNYSSSSTAADRERRTEILGKLEKYAMDSHLTGITLFENGGYVKYSDRLNLPVSEYITGYGFGILSDGTIDETKDSLIEESNPDWVHYLHSAQTSDPNKINAWNASGSQVSDLNGYITSSYYGTRLNDSNTGIKWYPVLAKNVTNQYGNVRPEPINPNATTHLSKTWRIYVKTGADGGLKYRYNGNRGGDFDGRLVTIEDYATPFKLLLTGANKQSRGAEMAGDKTYGIKGAQSFYNRTKLMTNQTDIDNLWTSMRNSDLLGIKTGSDAKGSYLQLELVTEIDDFTAMYTLSSNLYSPIPEAFIQALDDETGTTLKGIKNYGVNSGSGLSAKSITDNTICLSPYYLEEWVTDHICFKKNSQWIETDRYHIDGVKIKSLPNYSQDDLFNLFEAHQIDSCGVPQQRITDQVGKPGVKSTKGDSTFKLNVNSCSQERWDELNVKQWKNPADKKWNVKPWMSNENFLNGLFWSIDRKTFAAKRGVQPSIDYFSNAYYSDPESFTSYNSTDAHKQAIAKWHSSRAETGDNFGYDFDKAVKYFNAAVNQLVASGAKYDGGNKTFVLGTPSNPTEITIHIMWMGSTDINDYGNDIKQYFEAAFNHENVCGGRVHLTVEQDTVGDSNWEAVYNDYMMKGRFDLAFGAISGNTYNPLNFMEVLKSDNSSTFTLNWGADTSKVDSIRPIVFEGKKWSYDSLWEVSNSGGVVDNGETVKLAKQYKFSELPTRIDNPSQHSNDYSVGIDQKVDLEFVSLPNVEINVSKVQVYVAGGNNYDVTNKSYDESSKRLTFRIDSTLGGEIKDELDSIYNNGKVPGDDGYINNIFSRSVGYNVYWTIEVYFTLSIGGGTPSENMVTLVWDY